LFTSTRCPVQDPFTTPSAIGCRLPRDGTPHISPVSHPRIGTVGLETEKSRINERVQHALTLRPLQAAQPLHLFPFQSQPRHFEILRAESNEQVFVQHDDLVNELRVW
jgi:hypothetical protein